MDPSLAAKPPPGPPRQQPLQSRPSFEEDRPPSAGNAGRSGGPSNSQPGSQTNGVRPANLLHNAPPNFPLNTTYTKESSDRVPAGPGAPQTQGGKGDDRERRVPEPDRWTRPSDAGTAGTESQRRPDAPAKPPAERSLDAGRVMGEAPRERPSERPGERPGERPPSASGDRNTAASLPNGANGFNGVSTRIVERTSSVRPPLAAPSEAQKAGSDGDHDSGVDESTQGRDVNGAMAPARLPIKPRGRPRETRGPRDPSAPPATGGDLSPLKSPLKSPRSASQSVPRTPDGAAKKLPMNKIQVGAAPSPNLKTVRSKIGSLQNAAYKPGGGRVKIESRKLEWKAAPKIEALNDTYVPRGGDKKIEQKKLVWNAKSKIGSLENTTHKPGGGDKKIESVKLDFKDKAKPKIGSKENMTHKPGGGKVKIEDQKLEVKAQSKIGSLDNVKHRPGGGDRKIFDDKDYLRQMSTPSERDPSSCRSSRAPSEGRASGAHSPMLRSPSMARSEQSEG